MPAQLSQTPEWPLKIFRNRPLTPKADVPAVAACLAPHGGPHKHEPMAHNSGLIQLDDLQHTKGAKPDAMTQMSAEPDAAICLSWYPGLNVSI